MASEQLLVDERPLILLPSLVKAVGFETATVLQQVHYYLQNPKSGEVVKGEKWIFNTYTQWRENDFPFWSERTIQKWFLKAEKKGLLRSCQPGANDRTKYYRIDYKKVKSIVHDDAPSIVHDDAPSIVHDDAPSIVHDDAPCYNEPKTSTKTSPKREAYASAERSAKPSRSARPTPVSFLPDEQYLESLQSKPAYQNLSVRHVYSKMQAWCEANRKTPTRRRLVNWLNREDQPLTVTAQKPAPPKCANRDCDNGRVRDRVPCPKCKGQGGDCDYKNNFHVKCFEGKVPGLVPCPTCKGKVRANAESTMAHGKAAAV